MRRIKAKPLSFLIGVIILAVSLFAFMETPRGGHSLAVVGIVVGSILLAYGIIPWLQIGREGDLADTIRALVRPVGLGILFSLVTATILALGSFAYNEWLKPAPTPTPTLRFRLATPTPTLRFRLATPTPTPSFRLRVEPTPTQVNWFLLTPSPTPTSLQLGPASIATGTGSRQGYYDVVECKYGGLIYGDNRIAQGTQVTIVDRALQCSPSWYQVRTPDGRLLWFHRDDLSQ